MKIRIHSIDWCGGWVNDYGTDAAIDIIKQLPETIEMEIDAKSAEDYLPECVQEYIAEQDEMFCGIFPRSCKYDVISMKKAFTLIELLAVIGIIAIIASLIFPAVSAVNKTATNHRARVELVQLETAIENYKDKIGYYPPDNAGLPSTNQLFYELMGTTNTSRYFQTLDGSAVIANTNITRVFTNVMWFNNCVYTHYGNLGPNYVAGGIPATSDNDEERTKGIKIIRNLKPNQWLLVPINSVQNCAILGSTSMVGPANLMFKNAIGATINPWQYNSSAPIHNPNSFDLWIDVLTGSKTNRICNWSDRPITL